MRLRHACAAVAATLLLAACGSVEYRDTNAEVDRRPECVGQNDRPGGSFVLVMLSASAGPASPSIRPTAAASGRLSRTPDSRAAAHGGTGLASAQAPARRITIEPGGPIP